MLKITLVVLAMGVITTQAATLRADGWDGCTQHPQNEGATCSCNYCPEPHCDCNKYHKLKCRKRLDQDGKEQKGGFKICVRPGHKTYHGL